MKQRKNMDWDASKDAFARPPKLTPEEESELVADWLSREAARERHFVEVIRLFMRAHVRVRWPGSWKHMDNLEQEALVTLIELRETPEGLEKIRPPLAPFVKELIERPARILRREKKPVTLKKQDVPVVPNQEDAVFFREMLEIASNLPRGGARTLLAQAEHVAGEGPELPEALGLDAESAHKRLVRAQAAVVRQLQEDEEDNG